MADLDQVAAIPDPVERALEVGRRMAEVTAWHSRMREIRQAALIEMRQAGMSFGDIGKALGMHRNRAQQIVEGRSGGGQGGKRTEEPAG